MSRRDKIGVVILIGLFITFFVALAFLRKPAGPARYENLGESPLVQRIVEIHGEKKP